MATDNCQFCNRADDRAVIHDAWAQAWYDRHPVSEGHMLIVPRRHFADYFECTPAEREALWAMVADAKAHLDEAHSPDGYNVGINVGRAAGQSVMHLHIHLIPRYAGDVENPQGGVRSVIPAKQRYTLLEGSG